MRMAICSRRYRAASGSSRPTASNWGCSTQVIGRQTASSAKMGRRCSLRRTTECCGSGQRRRALAFNSEGETGRWGDRNGLPFLPLSHSSHMQALILSEYRKFTLADVPRPELGPTDVLVRVAACGICGSDVHGYDGSSGRRVPPIVMGHEAAGTVAEVGSDVRRVKVGDRVTFDSTISCSKCEACQRGDVNLCTSRRVLGVSCGEYRQPGAF